MEKQFHEQHRDEVMKQVWEADSMEELRQIMEEEDEFQGLLNLEAIPQATRLEIREAVLHRMAEVKGVDVEQITANDLIQPGEAPIIELPEDIGYPLNPNTYSYLSFLLMDSDFCSHLFEVNTYREAEDLREAAAHIDTEIMEHFGEDAADFMSIYIRERIRLLQAGKATVQDGISGVAFTIVDQIAEEARQKTKAITQEIADNARQIAGEVALMKMKTGSKKNQ